MNIKKYFPERLFYFIKSFKVGISLLQAYFYDFKLYFKHSGAVNHADAERKLIAAIIMNYHVIEKGLTMPETRFGFGRDGLLLLISNCLKYIREYDKNNAQLQHAISVVNEYKELHIQQKFTLNQDLVERIDYLLTFKNNSECHYQMLQTNDGFFKHRESAFDQFSNSRVSLRNYSGKNISIQTIKNVLELTRNTPSACNRQCVHSYVYTNPEKISEILLLQGGNRGFGHLTNKLIVITAEVGKFFGVNERNEAYIDGGMFAMNLLYSLHFHGIGACILNCSHDPNKDKRIRKATDIKESEVFIAMISCGYAPDTFKLASSKRCEIDSTVTIKD